MSITHRLQLRTRVLAAIGFFAVAVVLFLLTKPAPQHTADRTPRETVEPTDLPTPPAEPPPGDTMLGNYGAEGRSPEQDLTSVHQVLTNFQTLLKGPDPLPLGSNEELTAALTGDNPAELVFLSPDHPAINAQGQLTDRWNSALFFHANDRTRIDIRSAGPDGEMWTEDDLHRNADGSFRQGASLNADSLFPPPKPGQ